MKKFDISILTIAVLILGLVVLGFYESAVKKNDPVLAKAGQSEITQHQLYNEMKGLYGKQMLTELVAQSLIRQEAKQQNITVSQEEIDKEIDAMKQQIGSEQAFLDYLGSMGMDLNKLKDQMNLLMTRDKLLDKAYPVTDEQVAAYYEEHKSQLGSPAPPLDQVKEQITMILVDSNRAENYDKWWSDLQEKHHVEYFDPALKTDQEKAAG
ncbi:regulator [Brevibacillus panacihumi W25]|uniref:peptidylprolyl isomerase n=1 Tax=Brevibacillus panacihumi W25 TaxID=1408254 RepID=V6M543_9BACL|nr:SurA N-terminal domain-containing protein [Brevibacillus panacihumi]EST53716.1 regulator [Brevibacillus panacihumi W25]HZG79673.1 SurA N-terminal domain-containing protein [Brevibacillus sp.]